MRLIVAGLLHRQCRSNLGGMALSGRGLGEARTRKERKPESGSGGQTKKFGILVGRYGHVCLHGRPLPRRAYLGSRTGPLERPFTTSDWGVRLSP